MDLINEKLIKEGKFSSKIEELLDYVNEANDLNDKLREKLLKEMQDEKMAKGTSGKYSITLVVPKDIETFNDEKFLLEENDEVILNFTNFEDIEEFNLEKFKLENPEIYKKYTTISSKTVIDVDSLKKSLAPIYKKYVKIEKPNKKPSLRITNDVKKEKK